jgi:hypothetical protein
MIVGGIIAWQTSRHDAATMTSTATASIVESTTLRRSSNDNNRQRTTYSCRYTYEFTVDGDTVSGQDEDQDRCSESQDPGTERTVYYDPDSPEHSAAHNPAEHTHWWIVMEVVGLLCLLWGGASIWFRRYLSRLDRRAA